MKIFVINLADRTDRRRNVEAQLGDIPFNLFPAVSTKDRPEQYFRQVGKLRFLLQTGRLLARGEIACHASHLLLWRKCIELDEPIVILEDDFHKTEHFEAAIARAAELIDECGFIRLEPPDKRTIESAPLLDGPFTLQRMRRGAFRTTCYAISPATAGAFVASSLRFVTPVDHMIRKNWKHQKPLYILSPSAVQLDDIAEDDSMQGRDKGILRHLVRIPLFIYKNWADRYALIFDRRFESLVPKGGQIQ